MAGFQVAINGRFWVATEAPSIAMSNMVRKSYPALAAEKFVVIRHGFDAASFTA